MNANYDNEDAPLDPAVERVRRKMMRLMAISVAIMMIGVMAVIGAIFYKISNRGSDKFGSNIAAKPDGGQRTVLPQSGNEASGRQVIADLTGNIDLPEGATILKADLSGGQILLTVKTADGGLALWVYDLAANRVFARITINK